MTLHSSRRGISDVLSSLILVLTTVALSSIFFFWAIGYLGQSQGAISVGITANNARIQEGVSIDQVNFVESSGTVTSITVYFRNYVELPLTVDHVYINTVLYTYSPGITISGLAVGCLVVLKSGSAVGCSNTPASSTSLGSSGQTFDIRVATTRGNFFDNIYTAP